MTSIIQTDGLVKKIDGKIVIDHVNMDVQEGSMLGLVGPNGAGKTTLLNLLIGYYWPTRGEVKLFGEPLRTDASDIRQRVQYLAASGELPRGFRIEDLIRYHKWLYPTFDSDRFQRLLNALELPRTGSFARLSLGMKTQLRLAIFLAARPRILLLDEPTNGLDPVVKRQFLQFILGETADEGTTVVLATHQLEDVERLTDSLLVLSRGRAIVNGSLESLKSSIHEVHAVLLQDLPDTVRRANEVIQHQQRGSMHVFVVEGEIDLFLRRLNAVGADHVEVLSLSLDELFRFWMAKEGYTRDALVRI